jgi:hypothetical protein
VVCVPTRKKGARVGDFIEKRIPKENILMVREEGETGKEDSTKDITMGGEDTRPPKTATRIGDFSGAGQSMVREEGGTEEMVYTEGMKRGENDTRPPETATGISGFSGATNSMEWTSGVDFSKLKTREKSKKGGRKRRKRDGSTQSDPGALNGVKNVSRKSKSGGAHTGPGLLRNIQEWGLQTRRQFQRREEYYACPGKRLHKRIVRRTPTIVRRTPTF